MVIHMQTNNSFIANKHKEKERKENRKRKKREKNRKETDNMYRCQKSIYGAPCNKRVAVKCI